MACPSPAGTINLQLKKDTKYDATLTEGATDFNGWALKVTGRNANSDEELFVCATTETEKSAGTWKHSIEISKENTATVHGKTSILEIIYTDTAGKQVKVDKVPLVVCK